MPRKQPVDWVRARTLFEADPTLTQASLARMLNVSRKTVSIRAKEEGWKKVDAQPQLARTVRQRAYERADQLTADMASDGDPESGKVKHPDESSEPHGINPVTLNVSIEAKAKILERHRREWDGARGRIYKALQNGDFQDAKLGKITAEALQIIQTGERKAWLLDKEEEKTVELVYDRKAGGWE